MDVYIYDTRRRSKQLFVPKDPDNVLVYVCGPTVYDRIHIGNAFCYVIFDVLIRLLRARFSAVKYVRNITDVDDKINRSALENKMPISEWSERYSRAFHDDIGALGTLPPDVEPRATQHIERIQSLIESLINKGYAYEAEGHVLFHVPQDENYGTLSQRSLASILDGARVEIAPYKLDPKDFVLWKPSTEELPGWESPWGRGRPGWHIECTAMIHQHLGSTIDLHGGGSDLVFPHHENELAQGTCVIDNAEYVRYWMHNGMLNMGSEKMSKSLGNIVTVNELLQVHPGETIRYALLTGHYRQSLTWDERLIDQAQRSLDSLYRAVRHAEEITGKELGTSIGSKGFTIDGYPASVTSALADDLHTPHALGAMHSIAKNMMTTADPVQLEFQCKELLAGGWLLGILTRDQREHFQSGDGIDEATIVRLIDARTDAREKKNYALADSLRQQLLDLGVELEDTRDGTRWSLAKGFAIQDEN